MFKILNKTKSTHQITVTSIEPPGLTLCKNYCGLSAFQEFHVTQVSVVLNQFNISKKAFFFDKLLYANVVILSLNMSAENFFIDKLLHNFTSLENLDVSLYFMKAVTFVNLKKSELPKTLTKICVRKSKMKKPYNHTIGEKGLNKHRAYLKQINIDRRGFLESLAWISKAVAPYFEFSNSVETSVIIAPPSEVISKRIISLANKYMNGKEDFILFGLQITELHSIYKRFIAEREIWNYIFGNK